MKLSIIIPMYNVELYVEKCLKSCLTQNISSDEYEIIVVNDGSLDNSLQIATRIANLSSNIRIISQSNSGLSVARNTGLNCAKGEYVWFIDSDDWIENNCLSDLCDFLKKHKPDLCQIQYRHCYDDTNLNKDFHPSFKESNGKEILKNNRILIPAPFAIYNRAFLKNNNIDFYPGIYHEDCEFKPRVFFFAERCVSYNKILYNYYQRTGGNITSTPNPKRAFDSIKVVILINEFYNNIAHRECSSFFHNHISLMINNALFVVGNKEKDFNKEIYQNKHLLRHLIKSTILKYKIEGVLFSMFPKHTVDIYRFLKSLG